MAKKPDNKAKDTKADKKAKAPKSAKSDAKTSAKTFAKSASSAKSAARTPAKADLTAATPLTALVKPAAQIGKGSKKAKEALKAANKKAAKSAKAGARNLVPDLAQNEVVETAKAIGGQIMSVLNTDAGRVIAAEVLIYLARSLTKAAADTEAGKDATATVLNAGAKIGAAVANAGARAMESGGDVASAGSQAASAAAVTATDVAREVAQVAVSTVGGAVLDAAQNVLKRRGKSGDKGGNQRGAPANSTAPSGPMTRAPVQPA
jgi:hypothetical protein